MQLAEVAHTTFSIFKSRGVQLSGLGILSLCNETEARIIPIAREASSEDSFSKTFVLAGLSG